MITGCAHHSFGGNNASDVQLGAPMLDVMTGRRGFEVDGSHEMQIFPAGRHAGNWSLDQS